jgi:NTE family protein
MNALVLAGGGVAGIAWELGMIAGLHAAGVDLTGADLIVGTSAGAAVGAQVASGVAPADLLARQLTPPEESGEINVALDIERYRASIAELVAGAASPAEARARIGRMALTAETVPEATRRQVIASRLPVLDWPDRELVLVAVEATTGTVVTFDRSSGVPMVDAVAASCAVPGVWPAVTINERRYVDGGARSVTNADEAAGHDPVVVLIPMALEGPAQVQFDSELAALGAGTRVVVVASDAASLAAIGSNPLDPATRAPAARAGQAQAASVVDAVRAVWLE